MLGIDRIADQLIHDEGMRLDMYKCSAGKWTIGVGRNIEDRGISETEAMYLLHNDIRSCYQELQRNFNWFEELNTSRQEVLVNMCFNLGISRLMSFVKMLRALKKGEYVKAAYEMRDSKWYDQVGSRAERLCSIMAAV